MVGMYLQAISTDGVFSARHAANIGVDGTTLRRLVKDGDCHPLHRGWYAVDRPRNPREHHRRRTAALLQEYAGQVVASHGSAVVALGLPTEAIDFGTVHLMWVDPKKPYQAFSRTRIHETVLQPGLPLQDRTVHPALAVVQAGQTDPRALIVAADAGMRAGMIEQADLVTACSASKGQRGMTRVRAALGLCDPRHESPGESLTAFVLHALAYEFEPQFPPGTNGPGGKPQYADFRISGTCVLVEFDGESKYSAADPEQSQALLFAEKRREDRIRALGWEVVRLTWADLYRPDLVRAKIEAAIARGRSRPKAG